MCLSRGHESSKKFLCLMATIRTKSVAQEIPPAKEPTAQKGSQGRTMTQIGQPYYLPNLTFQIASNTSTKSWNRQKNQLRKIFADGTTKGMSNFHNGRNLTRTAKNSGLFGISPQRNISPRRSCSCCYQYTH